MNVTEIFTSIDGEVNHFGQGVMTTFIRLAGCNLACSYCDTPKAHHAGKQMTIPTILLNVIELGCRKITITGGEPLLQAEETLPLIDILTTEGYDVSIETNGTLYIPLSYIRYENVSWVVDYKLDYEDKMLLGRLPVYVRMTGLK